MISCAMSAGCGANYTLANQCTVDFVDCMDSTRFTTAEEVGAACAKAQDLAFDAIDACFAGADGDALLAEASALWNEAYPGSAYIPATDVDGVELDSPSYDKVRAAMCAAGSQADACSEHRNWSRERCAA